MATYEVYLMRKRQPVVIEATNLKAAIIKAARKYGAKRLFSIRRLAKSGREFEALYLK